MKEVAVLLHNIRSAHNVGSIFRTSDAAGVSRVFLTGYTPTPVDRFGRAQKEIAKTALGAELLPWEHEVDVQKLIARLKSEGWIIIGIEQDARSIPYQSYEIQQPTVFILGSEVEGIAKDVLDQCDIILEIPMHGKKESLNVSVAAGIVLFGTGR